MSELDLVTSQGSRTESHHRTTTFLDLLRRQMSGSDRSRRKRTLKERLKFESIGWCIHSQSSREDEIEEQRETESITRMNLATALEAERYNNRGEETETETTVEMTPTRVSLMRLLEETTESFVNVDGDGKETDILTASIGTLVGNDSVCCVCMGRKKGAAFIPCGHTFCRVCSRELWLNRGSCPLCNRPIVEILDLF